MYVDVLKSGLAKVMLFYVSATRKLPSNRYECYCDRINDVFFESARFYLEQHGKHD